MVALCAAALYPVVPCLCPHHFPSVAMPVDFVRSSIVLCCPSPLSPAFVLWLRLRLRSILCAAVLSVVPCLCPWSLSQGVGCYCGRLCARQHYPQCSSPLPPVMVPASVAIAVVFVRGRIVPRCPSPVSPAFVPGLRLRLLSITCAGELPVVPSLSSLA